MNDHMTSCPYNPLHCVKRSRLQAHIIKCQKNYPDFVICPYNATHRFPEHETKDHFNNCPNNPANVPEISEELVPLPETSDRCSTYSKSYQSSVYPESTVKSSMVSASLDKSSYVESLQSEVKEPMGALFRPIAKYHKPLRETDPNHHCWDD